MDPELTSKLHPKVRPFVAEILGFDNSMSGFLLTEPLTIDPASVFSSSLGKPSPLYGLGDGFTVRVPFCQSAFKVTIVMNAQRLDAGLDMIMDEANASFGDFLACADDDQDYVLSQWNPHDPSSLAVVIKRLCLKHTEFQLLKVKRRQLKDHRRYDRSLGLYERALKQLLRQNVLSRFDLTMLEPASPPARTPGPRRYSAAAAAASTNNNRGVKIRCKFDLDECGGDGYLPVEGRLELFVDIGEVSANSAEVNYQASEGLAKVMGWRSKRPPLDLSAEDLFNHIKEMKERIVERLRAASRCFGQRARLLCHLMAAFGTNLVSVDHGGSYRSCRLLFRVLLDSCGGDDGAAAAIDFNLDLQEFPKRAPTITWMLEKTASSAVETAGAITVCQGTIPGKPLTNQSDGGDNGKQSIDQSNDNVIRELVDHLKTNMIPMVVRSCCNQL